MADARPLEGKRVLLLEDDADSRDVMATLLELAGANVVSTATAEGALARFSRTEFDAVVTDVAMPGRVAVETQRELSQGEMPRRREHSSTAGHRGVTSGTGTGPSEPVVATLTSV